MRPLTGTIFVTLTIIFVKIVAVSSDTIAEYLCENQPPNSKLQHPEHCDVYLVCRNDKAIEMKCDPGVMFNPRKNECDPKFKDCPKNVVARGDNDDDDDDGDEEADPEEPESSDGEEDEDAENEESNEDDGTAGEDEDAETPITAVNDIKKPGVTDTKICPKTDTEQVTFIMHETDCSLYFLCYHGKPIPFECSMGMHWSNKQKKCVPKEVSECGQSISHSMNGGCPERGIKFMPHPNVCQNFIFCLNGAQTVQRCEPFYHWDVNEAKCKLKTVATCYRNLRQAIDSKTVNRRLINLRLNTKRFGL